MLSWLGHILEQPSDTHFHTKKIQVLLEALCIVWGADLRSLTVSLPSAVLLLSGCALVLQLPCRLNKLVHIAESPADDATLARESLAMKDMSF